jgi:cytochrome c peroxidase
MIPSAVTTLVVFAAATAFAPDTRKPGVAVPLGLLPLEWPKDNPYSPDKAELGRLLYFDKRLSKDGTIACASCHSPEPLLICTMAASKPWKTVSSSMIKGAGPTGIWTKS